MQPVTAEAGFKSANTTNVSESGVFSLYAL